MSLHAELQALDAALTNSLPTRIAAAMLRADLALAAAGLFDATLKVGDLASDFALAEARGGVLRLSALRACSPVAVQFYRGGWRPYRDLGLRARQQALPAFKAAGAARIAVSPQTREQSLACLCPYRWRLSPPPGARHHYRHTLGACAPHAA